VYHCKGFKVLCFETLLQVFILRGLGARSVIHLVTPFLWTGTPSERGVAPRERYGLKKF